jgi:hypothetical protein
MRIIVVLGQGRDTYISDSNEMCYATIYIWETSNDIRNIFNRIMNKITLC